MAKAIRRQGAAKKVKTEEQMSQEGTTGVTKGARDDLEAIKLVVESQTVLRLKVNRRIKEILGSKFVGPVETPAGPSGSQDPRGNKNEGE